ncbi:MAG: ABC transporter permease subunit [Oscillospiraceae bacterium]
MGKTKEVEKVEVQKNKKSPLNFIFSGKHSKTIQLTLMALPGALFFILFRYLPMAGLTIAFKDYLVTGGGFWKSLAASEWVGFDNFKFLFATSDVLIAIRNTLCYNIVWIFLGLFISVAFAVMLHEITNKKLAKVYQTTMFFPYFLSWVITATFVFAFLSHERGFLNSILEAFGHEDVKWYAEKKYWPFILTFMHIWKITGYNCVIYLAAICGIDNSLYEAAMIDGASRMQRIRKITIPMLKPMMVILTIMAIGRIFAADFGLFYNVPQANMSGALKPVVDVVDTYIYNSMINLNDFGMSTAAGLAQSAIGLIMIVGANFVVRKVDEDLSLF